jgi:3-polyprenyl-4-hydroxybenzoate decarboxylase
MGGLVVGISGATGVIYGVRMLRALAACKVETHEGAVVRAATWLDIEWRAERLKGGE